MMRRRHSKRRNKGFTLVEIAVVLVAIGILVGGILKGGQMMTQARVKATIKQVDGFKAALETFQTKYSALPGDFPRATTRIKNCNAASFCTNGNADDLVGETTANNLNLDQTTGAGNAPETIQFWKHLALADMIIGVVPNADPANPIWGETHPISNLDRGGYHVLNTRFSGNDQKNGHFLRIQSPVKGTPLGGFGENVAPAAIAMMIDQKLDDGDLDTGYVFGRMGLGAAAVPCVGDNLGMLGTAAGCSSSVESRYDCGMFIYLK